MENPKNLQPPTICKKCGEVNYTSLQRVKREWVHTEDKRYIRVIYTECERCKEKLILQIDSKRTIELRDKTIRLLLARKRDEFEKVDKRLTDSRNVLNKQFSGLKLFDENENIFVNCLTLQKDGDIIESDL